MLQKIRNIMKNDKGFTLIELIVVVVILGILAAVAIPRFMDRTGDATDSRIDADTKVVQNAIDMYLIDNPTVEDTAIDVAKDDATDYDFLIPDYLKDAPEAPTGYYYQVVDGVFQVGQ